LGLRAQEVEVEVVGLGRIEIAESLRALSL
jgi:hypothetical protein